MKPICFSFNRAIPLSGMAMILLLFMSLSACNKKDSENDASPNCDFYVEVSTDLYDNGPNDPFTFKNVEIKDDCLELTVSYGGGCKEVSFRLFDAGGPAKSNPVQRNLRLSLADDDNCEALVTKTISFDLVPLRIANEERIVLNVEGVDSSILYEY